MKTFQKVFFLIALTGILMIQSAYSNAQTATPGVYKTYADYLQKHLTPYDEIKLGEHAYKAILNNKKLPAAPYKNADFWGFQDENGFTYRVNKKMNIIDRVITRGAVCLYAGRELQITLFEDGRIKSQNINAENGTKFSEVFWVSQGGEGEMIGASADNLTKLLADTPSLVDKIKQTGIDEKSIKNWLDNFANVNAWIAEYDKAHK